MSARYPGYDVLSKRWSPSWNDQTRAVIDARMKVAPDAHRFLDDREWGTLCALCARIVPQPSNSSGPAPPVAAMLDDVLAEDLREGFRDARMPPLREAWQRGLRALDAEAQQRHGMQFAQLPPSSQDALLVHVQRGETQTGAWGDMPPKVFFARRVLHDLAGIYFSHPTAWSDIGFGGPASPRGYVRLSYDRRDPWEAAEAHPGSEERARRDNAHVG